MGQKQSLKHSSIVLEDFVLNPLPIIASNLLDPETRDFYSTKSELSQKLHLLLEFELGRLTYFCRRSSCL